MATPTQYPFMTNHKSILSLTYDYKNTATDVSTQKTDTHACIQHIRWPQVIYTPVESTAAVTQILSDKFRAFRRMTK